MSKSEVKQKKYGVPLITSDGIHVQFVFLTFRQDASCRHDSNQLKMPICRQDWLAEDWFYKLWVGVGVKVDCGR